LSAKLLKNGTLKTYKGFPHGMPTTQAETINADLLAFIKAEGPRSKVPDGFVGNGGCRLEGLARRSRTGTMPASRRSA